LHFAVHPADRAWPVTTGRRVYLPYFRKKKQSLLNKLPSQRFSTCTVYLPIHHSRPLRRVASRSPCLPSSVDSHCLSASSPCRLPIPYPSPPLLLSQRPRLLSPGHGMPPMRRPALPAAAARADAATGPAGCCVHTSTTKRRRRRHLSQTYRRFRGSHQRRRSASSATPTPPHSSPPNPLFVAGFPRGVIASFVSAAPASYVSGAHLVGHLKFLSPRSILPPPRQIHETTTFHSSLCNPLISSIRRCLVHQICQKNFFFYCTISFVLGNNCLAID
jgi:hypothetical protein